MKTKNETCVVMHAQTHIGGITKSFEKGVKVARMMVIDGLLRGLRLSVAGVFANKEMIFETAVELTPNGEEPKYVK